MTSLPNSDIRVWRYISADTQILKQPTCCSKRQRAVSKGGGGGTQNVDLRVQDEINKDFVFFMHCESCDQSSRIHIYCPAD